MTKPTALLVCGSRLWRDEATVATALRNYPRGTFLVHGGAVGADQIAGAMCYTFGWHEAPIPYFGHLGKSGGFARNVVMARLLVAMRDEGGFAPQVEAFIVGSPGGLGTPGTALMCRIAEEHRLPVRRHYKP